MNALNQPLCVNTTQLDTEFHQLWDNLSSWNLTYSLLNVDLIKVFAISMLEILFDVAQNSLVINNSPVEKF